MGVEYFERLYAAEDDPWDVRTSAYEHRKYAATSRRSPTSRPSAGRWRSAARSGS